MNLVLISLDAVFAQDWELLLNKPNIGPLLRKGLRCRQVQTVYPSLTYPIHVSMLTGRQPQQHGVIHNQFFDPAEEMGLPPQFRARLDKTGLPLTACKPWHWDHKDIQGETLFDACQREGRSVCSILWPVSGKHRGIRWNFPEVLAMPWENQALKSLRYGSIPWILSTEIRLGRQRKSTREPYLSDYAIVLAEDVLRRKKIPQLTAIHLVDCDAMRHIHGVYSQEALAALDRLDQRVGRILKVLEETGHQQDTCLMLVSDHGQEDVNQRVTLEDALTGYHVRVQSLGRGAYLHFMPGFDHEREALKNHLAALDCVAAVYDQQPLAVDAAEGVLFIDGLGEAAREKATHGFGPEHAAAQCILSLTGPGIIDEEKERMQVTDIAGLCASVLGLQWRPAP